MKKKMKRGRRYHIIILVVLFSMVFWPAYMGKATVTKYSPYWTLDEYIHIYPEQSLLMDRFSSYVRSDYIPLQREQRRPLSILVVYPGLQVSDYWRRSLSSFEARMKEIGIKYNMSFHFTKPGEEEFKTQSLLLEEAAKTNFDFLVFTLDAMRHKGMIGRILVQGKTKAILQNITTPIRSFGRKQPFLYVGFDHVEGTRLLAEEYKRRFPAGARYAIFYAEKGYVSSMRGDTFLQEMSGQENMKLVASYYVPFDVKKSHKAAMELLAEHEDIDFIYASSTDIAHGIIEALKETGRIDEVVVNGWGGGQSELDAIEAGEMDFSVMRMNDDNGVAMAEALRLFLLGRENDVPTVFAGEFKLVDKNVPAERLKKWKEYAFRYSK